jgi:LuxR family maltose regulon positive regulatory protein
MLRGHLAQTLPHEVPVLHVRASEWFEQQGLIDEAIHHALAAGDLDQAAHLMISGMREMVNREDWPTLERWLHLLPEEMIRRQPELLMIRVWVLELQAADPYTGANR